MFKKNLFMLLAVVVLIIICLLPDVHPIARNGELIILNEDGKATIGVLAFAVILWITEAIPFPVTGLVSILLLFFISPLSFGELISIGFGNTVVMFFIGAMTISAALSRSGLTNRITLYILNKTGLKTNLMVLAFLATSMFLSMWITNMAVAAMFLPIGVGILNKSKLKPLVSRFGKSLMISIAWGSAIGGIATPIGNGANILAIGYLNEFAGVNISFLKWTSVGLPACLLILPIAWVTILRIYPPEINELPISEQELKNDLISLGPVSKKEKAVLIIFMLTLTLWLFDPLLVSFLGYSLPAEVVALIAATFMFFPNLQILTWNEAEEIIDWGAIILIASGLSIGIALFETGAAHWLAWVSLSNIGLLSPMARILVVIIIVELLKIGFSSNTVTGVIIIPIVIALCLDLKIEPWLVAGPAAIASSLAFILVTSSPTNVIPYSAGYFTIVDFAKAGVALTIISAICIMVSFVVFGF